MISAETVIVVPFHDVDSMGIVWHGHYLKYFELARCDLLDKFDFGYREMAQSGFSWPIIDTRIKYVRPVVFEQRIVVVSTLKEWEYRLKIDYVIHDHATNKRLTKGHSIQAAVHPETGELCIPLPDILGEKLALIEP
jgi:acyl-CoA thioester hydrolase